MRFGYLKNEKKTENGYFHPLYLLAVAVRLTITANLLDSLYPLAQHISHKTPGSKTAIYQR